MLKRAASRRSSLTIERLKAGRKELFEPELARYHGRIFKIMGDGLLAEFPSVVDAVRCAVEVQREMAERNAATPVGQRIEFRIGDNLGDVIVEEHDIFGDGVNVAARLEGLAEPGGICISRMVRDNVRDNSITPSRTLENSRSKTSPGRFASSASRRLLSGSRQHRPSPHSRYPTSPRSPCCPSPI